MPTELSSVSSKELNEMKSKQLKTIVISLAFIAALATGAYLFWNGTDKEATSPIDSQANLQSGSEKSTGRKWLSELPRSPNPDRSQPTPHMFNGGDGKLIDMNGTTVTQYVRSLYAKANNGDMVAAYNIYSAETACVGATKRQRELSAQPTEAEQGFCKDFNFSPKERLDYLNMAAKGGNSMALVTFGTEAPEWLSQDPENGMKDPRYTPWTQQAFDYNQQAAQQGSSIAMFMLSDSYARGLGVQQNYQLAVTYDLSFKALSYPNKDLATIQPNPNYAEQLTPDEIAQARSAASALIKSIPH